MNIIIDAMGGDNAPREIVKAVVEAVNEFDINITLVGKESLINEELSKCKVLDKSKIKIHNAEEIVTNEDAPAMAIKSKKDSSMVVGLNLLKEGIGDGFISAGNTGAILAGSLLIVKRINGVDRPTLAPVVPTKEGAAVIVDGGSNVDCKPENLLQFALMGSIYMKKAYGLPSPRVGLVSVGTEDNKGNDVTKHTFDMLKNIENINFTGNIEGRDVPEGRADVVVCDGFIGNVILKVMEGMGLTIVGMLKEQLNKNIMTKIGALISMSAFKELKRQMDYKEYGGALILGVDGTVVKVHGSADAKLFYNTIKQAKNIIESGLVDELKEEIAKMEQ